MTEPIFPRNRVAALAVLLIPLAAAACNGDQQSSGRRPATPSSTVPSFGPAYGLIGDHASRTRDITSAGIAVIPNAEVSGYVDRFEQDLRTKTAGTGISLARNGKELVLTIPPQIAFVGEGSGIAPTIRTTLDAVARILAQYRQSYVDVTGFVDPALEERAAIRLGYSEADTLATYLKARGVLAVRIATLAAQSIGPTAPGARAEIKLVPLSEADLPPPPPATPNAAR